MILKVFIFIVLCIFVDQCNAGEWLTARGEHCITKCAYDGKEHYYYWCLTSDPDKVYSDGKSWYWGSSDRTGPGTRLKWDYCVPSEIPISPYATVTTARPPYNKGNLPINDGENQDLKDYSQPEGEVNYSKGPMSTLYPTVECSGACLPSGPRTVCDLKTNHPAAEGDFNRRWFYCADEKPFVREQITAIERFWCLDRCRKEGKDHFWCNTLNGPDHCSPSPNVGSLGTRCTYPCEGWSNWFEGKYNFCFTNRQNTTWEYCGNFNVPEDKKSIIEFTRYDNVCADYCQWDDDNEYQYCHYVYWDYNATINTAWLMKSWDYCRGFASPRLGGGAIAGIVFGSIAGVVALALIFAYCC